MTPPNTGPRPRNSSDQAVKEALALVGSGTYRLGAIDDDARQLVFDCTSFCMRHCYGIAGHRKGYNKGWLVDWSTGVTPSVVDDLNSNSAIEDAIHGGEVFDIVRGPPQLGDICAYPTIRLPEHADRRWIGHAAIVVGISRAQHHWDFQLPRFGLLDIVECVGPDGRRPAIRRGTGTGFDEHTNTWPKPEHRSYLLRVKP